ncbi:hypothetical protein OG369_37775 [Streptomyces sp. NBC_01221]|uniref:hypothetical protein n=1 Tax=Streptomyces sp. NBC_01221 TaxID=2903782 RepID=UPI002258D7EB|nr:hypothetical protein [Streptomyces sp. NBC_01221]MCX4791636.1 hypothetical protein [Streptomyces sp. NBC_01221]
MRAFSCEAAVRHPVLDGGRRELRDGGLVTREAQTRIHLGPDELTAWKLTIPEQWDTLLASHMARRLHACSRALARGTTLYLHDGRDPIPGELQ